MAARQAPHSVSSCSRPFIVCEIAFHIVIQGQQLDTAASRGGTRERPAVKVTGNDFTAPEGFEAEIAKGGQKTKYRKNVAAVKLLKVLEAENRGATPAEKIVLAQYTGWGHTPQAFVYTYAERTRLGQSALR